jgi:hypothetical protein
VIFASGLKYVGLGTYPLGWTMGGILVAALGYWLVRTRPWRRETPAAEPEREQEQEPAPSITYSP